MNSSSLLLLSLLCLPTADADAKAPSFTVHTADATPLQGTLQRIDDQWTTVLAGDPPRKINGADLVALRRARNPLPPPPAGAHVLFANGDRLPGDVGAVTGTRLAFTPSAGSTDPLQLPLQGLSALWFHAPADLERPDLLRRRLLAERRTRDLVWLRNGDQLQGNLARLGTDDLAIEVGGKEVKVERNQVAVIALNNELARTLKPKGTYGCLVLVDGSRLSVASVQADAQTLTARTLFGATLRVPLTQVIALDILQGRAVYLSDLKPASYQYQPWLPGLTYPWMADGSLVDGSPAGADLHLGGSVHVKGIGMHSPSRITFTLAGAYRRFEALVGLDGQAGRLGSVAIKVLVDGKPREWGWDKELTFRDGAKEVRVDVTGARELTLVVDEGKRFEFVQGRVNWADARLIK